jgi:hypothetical protein
MKKVIFGFIATAMFSTVSFAITPALENQIILKKENQTIKIKNENKKEETECNATCSQTVGGITYTTTAGNWFSSCERAERRCEEKLRQFLSW